MAENSKIEWTNHTFNPWIGCTKVSQGCANCYAEALMDKRMGKVKWGPEGTRVRTSAANWKKPLQWNRQAAAEGRRYKVFCASLADVFEDRPELVEWRRDLLVVIERAPNLDWLVLTKRPENVNRMIEQATGRHAAAWFADNGHIWIGTSVENQETANKRIPELLKIPAKVRFLSMEPLLGEVNLGDSLYPRFAADDPRHYPRRNGVEWVIVGGESGPNARPMHPDWARSIRDQCIAAGVAFHFKQWGEWLPMSHITQETENAESATWAWPWANGNHGDLRGDTTMVVKVGKHAAGRLLDERTWDEFPAVQP